MLSIYLNEVTMQIRETSVCQNYLKITTASKMFMAMVLKV
jgi:hypothetical protein